jgi:AbiU2
MIAYEPGRPTPHSPTEAGTHQSSLNAHLHPNPPPSLSPPSAPMAQVTQADGRDAMQVPEGIPDLYRPSFTRLQDDILNLHLRWKMYRQLFGKGLQRIDLLNVSGATFFASLQWVLLCDVLLGLCRLTDTVSTGGRRKNLVLESLSKELTGEHRELASELEARLGAVRESCEQFRVLRNKVVAHRDWDVAFAEADPLPGVTREMVEAALEHVRDYINVYQVHFAGGVVAYEMLTASNDGETLIWALKRGAHYRLLESEGRIERGDLRRRGEYGDP